MEVSYTNPKRSGQYQQRKRNVRETFCVRKCDETPSRAIYIHSQSELTLRREQRTKIAKIYGARSRQFAIQCLYSQNPRHGHDFLRVT